jgi:hypothetical protein
VCANNDSFVDIIDVDSLKRLEHYRFDWPINVGTNRARQSGELMIVLLFSTALQREMVAFSAWWVIILMV